MQPQTRFALSGDVNIAYQVIGEGPIDLAFVMGWVSNIDEFWTEPSWAYFLGRLAKFSRLIVFDKRGTGLSDRVDKKNLPTLEERMDDVRAVMDACGSKRAALLGSFPKPVASSDYPWGRNEEEQRRFVEEIRTGWGQRPVGLAARVPSKVNDERFKQWWTTYLVRSATPKAVLALAEMNSQIDVRAVLPAISAPSLIMHRSGDRTLRVEGSRYMAGQIRGARFLELPGDDHLPWTSDPEPVLNEIEEFLTGAKHVEEPDRVLATVMFADIAGSTERAAAVGDRAWRSQLQDFYGVVRGQLERHRGREIDTAGDGYFATFDGPARGVRCAQGDHPRRAAAWS